MQSNAPTVEKYLTEAPVEQAEYVSRIREVINKNLPEGFEERMNYGMIGWVVPHSIYLAGYHCDPSLPLPFLSLAYQKNSLNIYHMGIYADPVVLDWFQKRYATQVTTKLDMGKSCIRFKKYGSIPYELIGELVTRISVEEWIALYETQLKKV